MRTKRYSIMRNKGYACSGMLNFLTFWTEKGTIRLLGKCMHMQRMFLLRMLLFRMFPPAHAPASQLVGSMLLLRILLALHVCTFMRGRCNRGRDVYVEPRTMLWVKNYDVGT